MRGTQTRTHARTHRPRWPRRIPRRSCPRGPRRARSRTRIRTRRTASPSTPRGLPPTSWSTGDTRGQSCAREKTGTARTCSGHTWKTTTRRQGGGSVLVQGNPEVGVDAPRCGVTTFLNIVFKIRNFGPSGRGGWGVGIYPPSASAQLSTLSLLKARCVDRAVARPGVVLQRAAQPRPSTVNCCHPIRE